MNYWRIEKQEYAGETAFIIGGGPSVLSQDLQLLQGRHVIAINSSYLAVPWADFVVFADTRWFIVHRERLRKFGGRIVSASSAASGPPTLLRMRRKPPPGLADDPSTVMIKSTSATVAINLAVHLGARRLVLLGLDGKNAADGKTHHHEAHPKGWARGQYHKHRSDLATLVEPLRNRGIECLLATPDSAYGDLWPIVDLNDCLQDPGGSLREPAAAAA